MRQSRAFRPVVLTLGWVACFAGSATAQPAAVPVGAGSYAEYPPAHEGGNPIDMTTRPLYVTGADMRPIPTNDWWTDLLASQYAGALWAYPFAVSADAQGLDIFYPTEFNGDGTHMMRRDPIEIQGQWPGGAAYAPADARASGWSDWLVSFRMAQDATHYLDVTIGHGLPYVWMEFTGVNPRIVLGSARYFNDAGTTLTLPVTADHLGIEYVSRNYGVYAPDGTQFSLSGGALTVTFAGADRYLIVAALPAANALATLYPYAYAKPLSSTMDWVFDPEASTVATTWTVQAAALKGTNTDVLQGWIPHHYRTTTHDLAFNGVQYRTPRGILKCAPGHVFHLTYPFHGLLPNLPAPEVLTGANPYSAARMEQYLAMAASVTTTANDTYWGGKDIERMARYLTMAHQIGSPTENALKQHTGDILRNWFTYTNGETEFYFAAYPRWGALVGFNESYNSGAFTDMHFHYGYHVTASALLGMCDPQFLADYGAMATLVAKDYANWDRNDTRFPFLRTFDVWQGHSYAAGFSSADGNNQESSSESIQSWGGLFLLGAVLQDDAMRAAGAMGHTIESAAVDEYWMDYQGYLTGLGTGNFSPIYRWPIAGIVSNQGQVHQTYFSPDPGWLRGIQWIPTSPFLSFLVRDKAFADWHYDYMMSERTLWLGATPNTISQMGTSLGNLVLGFVQMYDPAWAAAQMDQLWAANEPVMTENYTGGIGYYFTHANRLLGDIQWNYHTSLPTSQVYYNAARGEFSYVLYNPAPQTALASVYAGATRVGYVLVPPRTLVRATELLASGGPFAVLATVPENGDTDVTLSPAEVMVLFSREVNAATLTGVTVAGPGATGLTYPGENAQLVTLTIAGNLVPGATYTVTIPASVATTEGGATLGTAYAFSFTLHQNAPPTVDAGDDQVVRFGQAADLLGTVQDDGLPDPPAAVSVQWTAESGPGVVTFGDATAAQTTADFSSYGTYVLRLTADDGESVGFDELRVNVTSDLLAHYKLNETTGTAAVDSSGNGLHGTFIGGPALGQPGAAAGTGTSVDFNGTSQDVSLGSPTVLNELVNNFTIATWIRPDPTSGYRIIFGAGWQDYNGWSFRLLDGRLTLERLGPTQLYDSGVAPATGTWSHVAAVYDAGNDVTFYINGVAVGTVAGSAPASPCTRPWYLASNGTSEKIDGRLDDVQLYGRALDAGELAYLYTHPGVTLGPGPGDADGDGDIDLIDYAVLRGCLTGPGGGVLTGCAGFDFDADSDVDLADFAVFMSLIE